jgi:hypothetical protein
VKKVVANRKFHNLTKKTLTAKKFRANLKNHNLMGRTQAAKKKSNLMKANLKKEIWKQANQKKTKA